MSSAKTQRGVSLTYLAMADQDGLDQPAYEAVWKYKVDDEMIGSIRVVILVNGRRRTRLYCCRRARLGQCGHVVPKKARPPELGHHHEQSVSMWVDEWIVADLEPGHV